MRDNTWTSRQFEEHRARLHAIAYRMLGSANDADDAVQEAWLRVNRADPDAIENAGGWLTTVTARVCLNMLRSRTTRREDLLGVRVPDPIVTGDGPAGPDDEAMMLESVGLALLVVFESLAPAERLAFVLHDMFAVPFDEIAPIVGRSVDATRQLASRARRRVQGAELESDVDVPTQRTIIAAFFAAARNGDLDGLIAVLDPDVVLRADGGATRPNVSAVVHGSAAVAGRAMMFADPAATILPVLVNGAAGVLVTVNDHPVSVMAFTVRGGKIIAITALADPDRLARINRDASTIDPIA